MEECERLASYAANKGHARATKEQLSKGRTRRLGRTILDL